MAGAALMAVVTLAACGPPALPTHTPAAPSISTTPPAGGPSASATAIADVPRPSEALGAADPFASAQQLVGELARHLEAQYPSRFSAFRAEGPGTHAMSPNGDDVAVVPCQGGETAEFVFVRQISARLEYLSDPSAPQPWMTVPQVAVSADERADVAVFFFRLAQEAWFRPDQNDSISITRDQAFGPIGIQVTIDGSEASVVVAGPRDACG